jgi:hypothetical protein
LQVKAFLTKSLAEVEFMNQKDNITVTLYEPQRPGLGDEILDGLFGWIFSFFGHYPFRPGTKETEIKWQPDENSGECKYRGFADAIVEHRELLNLSEKSLLTGDFILGTGGSVFVIDNSDRDLGGCVYSQDLPPGGKPYIFLVRQKYEHNEASPEGYQGERGDSDSEGLQALWEDVFLAATAKERLLCSVKESVKHAAIKLKQQTSSPVEKSLVSMDGTKHDNQNSDDSIFSYFTRGLTFFVDVLYSSTEKQPENVQTNSKDTDQVNKV